VTIGAAGVRRRWSALGRLLGLTCVLATWVVAWAAEPSSHYLPPPPVFSPEAGRVGETAAGEGSDVLLIVFSGRCAIRSCTPPDENFDALAQRLVPAVVAAWSAAGLEVEAWTYRSHVDDHPERGRGYASATVDLRNAVQDGILRPGSATRAVLLGYSHGTQFAHLLAFEHPQVRFAASVLLDSICLGWDADHAARLVEALAPGVGVWADRGPYRVGCNVFEVPDVGARLDLGDVVPWNVARSLEVRSGGQMLGVVRDVRDNFRPDGSTEGLEIVRLPAMHHQESDEPQGPSFDAWTRWVLEVLGDR
jgi:hypothetical protein